MHTSEHGFTAELRICLVEEDPEVLHFLTTALESQAGFIVRAFSDPRSALNAISEFRPDLVVTENAIIVLRNGANDFLVRPVSAEDLVATITRVGVQAGAKPTAHEGRTILAIGAHPDDVELGVGGILAAHHAAGDPIVILTLSRGEHGGDPHIRHAESLASAKLLGARLIFENLADTQISDGNPTVGIIEGVIAEVQPTVIYTHTSHDRHQDHRAVHSATVVAARTIHTVYGYQSPSATIDFRPTRFIPVDGFIEAKLAQLACFNSQAKKRNFLEPEFVRATARYWSRFASGMSCEPLEVIKDTEGI